MAKGGKIPAGEYFGMLVPYQSGQVMVLGNSGICGDNGGTPSPACGTISYGSNLMFLLNCFQAENACVPPACPK